jgi:tRNA G18 (ribose-2'-O)-methylase SpoU
VKSLLVDDRRMEANSDLIEGTRAQGAPVLVGSRALVAGTVGFDLHRGVVAVASRRSPTDPGALLAGVVGGSAPRGASPLVAVLEGLNDHENIGALFRNAAAFGVAGVLLDPTSADPLYRRSIRVSVGHVLHVPFTRLTPWPSGLGLVRAAGFIVAALVPHPSPDGVLPSVPLTDLRTRTLMGKQPSGIAVLLGAEGSGVTEAALALADVVVSIPMAADVDSLNVATAAAVAFHTLAGT